MNDFGQLFITGISGTTLTNDESTFIEKENIGGVILFSKNYESPAQLAELVNSIQMLRSNYPLFISVDHEGGRVQRFKTQFTHFPAMMDLSRLNSPKTCYEAHKIMAEELNACGINLNFSPCCDILTNEKNQVIGDRAFGSDPEEVEKYISAAIRGLQTTNVMACAKHFPGHGSTLKDSHHELPLVTESLEEITNKFLLPFKKATMSRVEFVMMGHLLVECLDPENPTSLSKKAYELLREELRFKKIIITDDMQMKAVTNMHNIPVAATMALDAGADMLIYRDIECTMEALAGVKESVSEKKLERSKLVEKVGRVNDCKKRQLASYKQIYIPGIESKVGNKNNQQFLKEVLEKIAAL